MDGQDEIIKIGEQDGIIKYEPINMGDCRLIRKDTDDDELIRLWVEKSRRSGSENTRDTYDRIARAFLVDVGKPIRAIMYDDVAWWAESLSGKINTKRTKINAIKSLFSFALKLGYIAKNPAIILEAPRDEETKHRKMLSEEEVIRLIASPDLSARDEAILRVLYSSAMRVSELCDLKWQDVITQGDKAVLIIRGKGGKTREAGISAGAYKAMLAQRKGNGYVFLSELGKNMHRTTVNWLFKKLSARLGKNISPHWFRHSHISHALARGANPVDVQEQAGHSSLAVTTGYAHKTKSSSDYLIV